MRAFSAVKQLLYLSLLWTVDTRPTTQIPIVYTQGTNQNITFKLFAELEELARIVDISYCVGTTGIHKPFICASRCQDFRSFELVTVSRLTHYALGPGVNLADRMMFCRLGTQDLCLPTHAATLPSRILHQLAE